MRSLNVGRVVREVLLGLLALGCALVILVPGLVAVDRLLHFGLYPLLVATVVAGALLLLYQARLRPSLREPALRAAAGIAEALRGAEEESAPRDAPSAFRTWGGVPIASLRVSLHHSTLGTPTQLAGVLCGHVRERARTAAGLTWALSEVGGNRFLLLQEVAPAGAPVPALRGALALSCVMEDTFHHLWSAGGPAGYEAPVAFATVLLAQAVAGREPDLHDLTVRLAERVARLPDVAGVVVLTNEARGGEAPHFLWLAAGRARSVRRQVYLALEPTSAAQGLVWSIDRYDLLACDAYALLQRAGQPVAESRAAGG
jgi:hypothetical protein